MSDWDAYFWEPGGDVLRNRLGLHNNALLHRAVFAIVGERMTELNDGRVEIPPTFDAQHLRAIHRHLFEDVYEWAGEYRTVGLARGDSSVFAHVDAIGRALDSASRAIKAVDWSSADLPQVVAGLATVAGAVNYAHPFRDGNGRAQKVFFQRLVAQTDFSLDFSRVTPAEWNYAFRRAMPTGDAGTWESPLRELFGRLTGVDGADHAPLPTPPGINFMHLPDPPAAAAGHWLEL